MQEEAAGPPPGHGVVQWSSTLTPNHVRCSLPWPTSLPAYSNPRAGRSGCSPGPHLRAAITHEEVPWAPQRNTSPCCQASSRGMITRDMQTPGTTREISATKSSSRQEFLCLQSGLNKNKPSNYLLAALPVLTSNWLPGMRAQHRMAARGPEPVGAPAQLPWEEQLPEAR